MVQDFAKIRTASAPEKASVPAPANRSLLVTGLVTGVALGVFGSFLVYLSGVLPPVGDQQVRIASESAALEADVAQLQQTRSQELERAAARLQLEFYQELPNYEVIVSNVPGTRTPLPVRRPPTAEDSAAVPVAQTAEDMLRDAQAEAIARTIAELTGVAPPAAAEPSARAVIPEDQPAAITAETRAGVLSYMIQAGAFQQEQAAVQQSNRLIDLGLDARVKKEALLGKTLFLVQAGPYHSREQLSQVERILRSNNIDSMRITLGGL
jgi:cell division protein FtsN